MYSLISSTNPKIAFKEEIDAILYMEDQKGKQVNSSMFGSVYLSISEIEYQESPIRDEKKVKKWAKEKVKEYDEQMIKNAERQDKENKTLVEENEKLTLRKREMEKYL